MLDSHRRMMQLIIPFLASALILLMHTELLTMLCLINSVVRSYFCYGGSPTAGSLV